MAYAKLDAAQARRLAGEAFPALIDEPAGGRPRLAAGERVTGYPAINEASVALRGGRRGVIESLAPIAVETAPGRRTPVSLDLRAVGDGFEPALGAVRVRLPSRLGQGASLSRIGVSLTPVDADGTPLEGSEGVADGASVFYANTQRDSDTVLKPTSFGFEADTLLRSSDSPEDLFFKVGLPPGASLRPGQSGSGVVNVVFAGRPIATVLPVSAHDAEGGSVPVSARIVGGDVLAVRVEHRDGSFRYPLGVDPSLVESEPVNKAFIEEDWPFFSTGPAFQWSFVTNSMYVRENYAAGEFGFLEYPTRGESHIYEATMDVHSYEGYIGKAEFHVSSSLRFEDPGNHVEGEQVPVPIDVWDEGEVKVCASTSCAPETVTSANQSNALLWEDYAYERGYLDEFDGTYTTLLGQSVYIDQEKGPSSALDTTDATFSDCDPLYEGLPCINAIYPGVWVSTDGPATKRTVIPVRAFDPGLGISSVKLSSPDSTAWGGSFSGCTGVQCSECRDWGAPCASEEHPDPLKPALSLGGESLPEGEDTVEASVADPVGLISAVTKATVKVDNQPPYGLSLSGLPANDEVGDAERLLKFKASATDGHGSIPASGVASIAVSIDGRALDSPSASCSPSPKCTATGEFELDAEEYAAGKHTLTVTATNGAGLVASENYTIAIHHAAPVAMGPGSVNPLTGDFMLSATDVSVSAPGAPLTVSRAYSSRHIATEANGALGPQWSLTAGAVQSISKVSSTGSLLLTDGSGQQTVFVYGTDGYTPPTGDGNLSLTEVAFEGSTELLLSSNGAVTTFRHVSGGSSDLWLPTISEGAGGTNATSFSYEMLDGAAVPVEESHRFLPGCRVRRR